MWGTPVPALACLATAGASIHSGPTNARSFRTRKRSNSCLPLRARQEACTGGGVAWTSCFRLLRAQQPQQSARRQGSRSRPRSPVSCVLPHRAAGRAHRSLPLAWSGVGRPGMQGGRHTPSWPPTPPPPLLLLCVRCCGAALNTRVQAMTVVVMLAVQWRHRQTPEAVLQVQLTGRGGPLQAGAVRVECLSGPGQHFRVAVYCTIAIGIGYCTMSPVQAGRACSFCLAQERSR